MHFLGIPALSEKMPAGQACGNSPSDRISAKYFKTLSFRRELPDSKLSWLSLSVSEKSLAFQASRIRVHWGWSAIWGGREETEVVLPGIADEVEFWVPVCLKSRLKNDVEKSR